MDRGFITGLLVFPLISFILYMYRKIKKDDLRYDEHRMILLERNDNYDLYGCASCWAVVYIQKQPHVEVACITDRTTHYFVEGIDKQFIDTSSFDDYIGGMKFDD